MIDHKLLILAWMPSIYVTRKALGSFQRNRSTLEEKEAAASAYLQYSILKEHYIWS